jgi:hypothetical protein
MLREAKADLGLDQDAGRELQASHPRVTERVPRDGREAVCPGRPPRHPPVGDVVELGRGPRRNVLTKVRRPA